MAYRERKETVIAPDITNPKILYVFRQSGAEVRVLIKDKQIRKASLPLTKIEKQDIIKNHIDTWIESI